MGMTAGGFFLTNLKKKMTWEHSVFERMDIFLREYGLESRFFVENGRFFTKYGHKSSDFFVNSRNEEHLIDFFGP